MREIILDATASEPFEIGATIVATLAFPGPADAAELEQARLGWCAKYILAHHSTDPAYAAELARRFPAYASMDLKRANRALIKTPTRYRRRMAAARMARGYFQEALTGSSAILAPGMDKFSKHALYRLVKRECRQSHSENVRKLVWIPTRPVIHLAAAFDAFPQFFGVPGMLRWDYDIANLDDHRRVVLMARHHERIVLADKRFGVTPQKLLRLRWVE